jgi:hypothetical protein
VCSLTSTSSKRAEVRAWVRYLGCVIWLSFASVAIAMLVSASPQEKGLVVGIDISISAVSVSVSVSSSIVMSLVRRDRSSAGDLNIHEIWRISPWSNPLVVLPLVRNGLILGQDTSHPSLHGGWSRFRARCVVVLGLARARACVSISGYGYVYVYAGK